MMRSARTLFDAGSRKWAHLRPWLRRLKKAGKGLVTPLRFPPAAKTSGEGRPISAFRPRSRKSNSLRSEDFLNRDVALRAQLPTSAFRPRSRKSNSLRFEDFLNRDFALRAQLPLSAFRFILLLVWLPAAILPGRAQPVAPAADTGLTISLLTCTPGAALYTAFGHSAVRVRDARQGIDVVFNYGTFDFDTPNFYGKFIRGKLLYQLSTQSMAGFVQEYRYDGRGVVEQDLLLDDAGREQLFDVLRTNYRPENRAYLYDFLFDNCATRIRDLVERELAPPAAYPTPPPATQTFRQLLHSYLPRGAWIGFGFDLVLGLPADRIAGPREQMFLPDYLAANLSRATWRRGPLLGPPRPLLVRTAPAGTGPSLPGPLPVFSALVVLVLILSLWRGGEPVRWAFDRGLLLVLGLLGAFLLFMWLGTDHRVTAWNLNLLWANPLFLLALAGWRRRDWRGWPYLFGLAGLLGALVLAGGWWLPQSLHVAVFPIAAVLLSRGAGRLWPARRGGAVDG